MFLSLLCFPPVVASIFPSMPWVGVHRRRWEATAWVCSGNHGNRVLIGQWPGKMIGSCCHQGLFMQTSGRVGRPQMGPDHGRRRRNNKNLFSLFPLRALKSSIKFMRSGASWWNGRAVRCWIFVFFCVCGCSHCGLPLKNNSISHVSRSPKVTCLHWSDL